MNIDLTRDRITPPPPKRSRINPNSIQQRAWPLVTQHARGEA